MSESKAKFQARVQRLGRIAEAVDVFLFQVADLYADPGPIDRNDLSRLLDRLRDITKESICPTL